MAPTAKVSISPLSDQDIPTAFQVLSKSFGHDAPFINIYFPNHDTPLGQEKGSKRLAAWKHSSEDSTFLKAVTRDGDRELIIGLAVWTLMKEAAPQELDQVEDVEEVWPDEGDREFMTRLWREYVVPRNQAVKDSNGIGVYGKRILIEKKRISYIPNIVLELLAVHPDYQRLGAGKALVKWGTKAADEQGLKVKPSVNSVSPFTNNPTLQSIVEGTPVARRLYEQCGLRAEIEEMRFDVGEEFSERKKPKLVFLTREPES